MFAYVSLNMKFAIFTYEGQGLPIAEHLQREGHDVLVGVVHDAKDAHADREKSVSKESPFAKKRRLSLYNGLLQTYPAWELVKKLKKCRNPQEYFLFFDFNNLFKFADALRDMNFHGNFPTEEDYLLELDRDAAKSFVQQHYPKLNVPEVHEFSTVKEAKKFLQKSEDFWVLKAYDDQVKTFVPDVDDVHLAREEVIHALETSKDSYEREGFILESLIFKLVEITPERIYYDGRPLATVIDIENKSFGSGNVSIQTGCSQDLCFPISLTDKINEIAFPPIVDEMAKKHKGLFVWDASILIDRRTRKMYFGEFCSNRVGYNSFFTELSLCPSVGHFFESVVAGMSPFEMGTVACSARIFNQNSDVEHGGLPYVGTPINYKPTVEKNLWLWDVLKKKDKLVTAGENWNLGVMTGAGRSINEAVNQLYANIDAFSFVGYYYRPKFDYVSLDYPTSILNRLNYGLERGLYRLPFDVKVGDLL